MKLFIFAIIFVIAFAIARVARALNTRTDDRRILSFISFGLLGIAVLLLGLGSFCQIGTKEVGLLTTFGKPGRPLDNGPHLKLPWQVKHELPDAVQTDTYASDRDPKDGSLNQQADTQGSCVNVKITRQSIACVNVSIRWQIKETGVDYLFRNYKDNDAITRNLLKRDLQSAVNDAFAGYDPLGLDPETGASTQPSTTVLQGKVKAAMVSDIGEYIDVRDVLIPIFNFDKSTQDKLNQLQQQFAATQLAKQQLLTNTAQAAANRALASSVSNNPGVLYSKCLDIVKEAVDNGRTLPAGFNCFGSSPNLALASQ